MGIETFKNPATRKEETVVSGVVSAIFMNPLKNLVTYDKGWTPTHSCNIVIDGVKVGLGLTDKEVIGVKDEDEKYHDLVKGLEITIPVTVSDYNGKPQYNGRGSEVLVISTDGVSAAKSAQSAGFKQPYTAAKRDNTGMSTGHALNGALNLIRSLDNLEYDAETVVELATMVHKVTSDMKVVYAKANPDMSDYDVGAAVGHAVLNATRDVSEATVSEITSHAEWILNDIVPLVLKAVKAEDKPEVKEEVKKPVAKKAVVKKTIKNEATANTVSDSDIPDSNFADEDGCPF